MITSTVDELCEEFAALQVRLLEERGRNEQLQVQLQARSQPKSGIPTMTAQPMLPTQEELRYTKVNPRELYLQGMKSGLEMCQSS